MKILYFTSTGNCLWIAKELGGELLSIPRMIKENRYEFEDDAVGIVFPCYYLGTPRIVEEFLRKAKIRANYLFAVMSYGNMSAGGLYHFSRTARKYGMQFSYLNEILMIDNYLPVFDMNEQKAQAPGKNIKEHITNIVGDISARTSYIRKSGFLARLGSYLLQFYYRYTHGKADTKFLVNDQCNGCKICERVCPVNNIKVDQRPTFFHQCEECLACVHHCSQNAIRMTNEKSSERYINEHVTLREILHASGNQ
ncbi:MAG TPA: EFR1 family ferrodoxin [Candidatus Ozemobacteraceae bacterium]|nr:EFR1 family ferrodoxin [Candidatus Ozemobacteraceae bacterium]